MRRIKYLLVVSCMFLISVLTVNAAETLTSSNLNSMTLVAFFGDQLTISSTQAMEDVLNIINDKEEFATTDIESGGPYLQLNYSNNDIKVYFYDSNVIAIDDITYKVNYDGDCYDAVATIFEEEVASTSTSENIINDLKITVEAETGNAGSSLYMNLTMPEGYGFAKDTLYYVKFVNENDAKPTDFPDNWLGEVEYDYYDITKWKSINVEDKSVHMMDDWYLLNGYEYAYFLSCDATTCVISDEPVKVTRPELPSLSQRYQVYAFADTHNSLNIFPYFPYMGTNGSHKLSVKIGIINDEELLYSVYKNEKNALTNLMKYAQESEGRVYSAVDDDFRDMPLDDLQVQNGAYYYIYTTYENTDGMYRDLSDISIAMGKSDMIVNDVDWNALDREENPSTGDISMVAGISAGLVIAGIAIISYKKYRLN